VKLNGKPVTVIGNRGTLIMWSDLTPDASIEIRQPMVIAEKHGLEEKIEINMAEE